MADRAFTTTKKGEVAELRDELRDVNRENQKEAVKKVIAAMTVGKDVGSLFPDVVKCIQTDNLELKKLVYLYVINYARTQPQATLLAVNTFQKDAQDDNPLIRALAVRTMGCIRVDKITEYLCDPLQKTLHDDDPYVRKTAAICVAKLYDINPELVEERGFLDMLRDLISDSNPMVVANAVASLNEISDMSGKEAFEITQSTLFKLIAAMNECTEWGQVFILDVLSKYEAPDAHTAETIIERVTPRLQHGNPAVALSAIKVILQNLSKAQSEGISESMQKKMAPPLVTLLSSEAEIQYVALRNINLIVQRYPEILKREIKVFFCKYNDPIYVKMEKLDIMVKLASEDNVDQVLMELKEYAQEVDVDFVRKAIRAIGRIAISLESSADRAVQVLIELIQNKVNYVVQEVIVVIKDIFRRYPNQYESVISTLCDNLESLDEPEAKASMIWIIGEYADRIDNADEILETFLETFSEETSGVQLQLLTATVKLFLKAPSDNGQNMVKRVLSNATEESDNPDLRDRAYIYWRLLSTDPEAARDIVLAEKSIIQDDSSSFDQSLLDELLQNIGTLASVYHKPADMFVSKRRPAVLRADEDAELDLGEGDDDLVAADSGGLAHRQKEEPRAEKTKQQPPQQQPSQQQPAVDLMGDLLDVGPSESQQPQKQESQSGPTSALDELLQGSSPPVQQQGQAQRPQPAKQMLLSQDNGKGLEISGCMGKENGQPELDLTLSNHTSDQLDGFQIKFNKNAFCIAPASQHMKVAPLAPGQSAECKIGFSFTNQHGPLVGSPPYLQVAVKSPKQNQVHCFNCVFDILSLLLPDGKLDQNQFIQAWKEIGSQGERTQALQVNATLDGAKNALQQRNLFLVHEQQGSLFFSGKVPPGNNVLVQLDAAQGTRATCRCQQPEIAPLVFRGVETCLSGH